MLLSNTEHVNQHYALSPEDRQCCELSVTFITSSRKEGGNPGILSIFKITKALAMYTVLYTHQHNQDIRGITFTIQQQNKHALKSCREVFIKTEAF